MNNDLCCVMVKLKIFHNSTMSSQSYKKKKKDWITPKANLLSNLDDTAGKILTTLPEGTYPTKDGGSIAGGS